MVFLHFTSGMALAQQSKNTPILGVEGNISQVKRYPASIDKIYTNPIIEKRISARSAVIMEETGGRLLFAKAPDDPRQPASTIKVLTGMIALKSMTGEESVPVSKEAASRPSSKMYLDTAKQYRADELISAVLLASSNDASVALAEMLGGTEEEFANYMTLLAEYWGATNTVCKTATGLTAKGQTSTARDLAIIFREAMRNPEFAEKMKKRSMKTDEGRTLYNHNKALWQIPGTTGGKTGYTLKARQTYVGKFTRGDSTIIVAVMGSETMWYDIKYLVNYGFKQYQYISPSPESIPPALDLLVDNDVPTETQNQ
ncbi:D-alanyl-D-alanine carboxypeptidase family protein [Desulfosediminicola flagellatus]|uniref:D-alanyl-D-alanine carboxypeptidase family protein n=1 Tax=Desulfosediminicola flagellatus TaxID=2569541 RepID=UPI00142E9739|nr:serine hydrolase [Desulfosediminicola flagellatus]